MMPVVNAGRRRNDHRIVRIAGPDRRPFPVRSRSGGAMSAPTPPPYRREWLPPPPPPPPPQPPPAPEPRPAWRTALDHVARLGTAVTLAALLVVTGTLLAALDAEPVPAGVSTLGH